MHIRDRIKELRRVRAGDLKPHPRNWRVHPESQKNALRGLLAEIGYADVLLTRELPDGSLQIIDGHLRAETTPDSLVPVLVTDLTEAEAEKVLLTLEAADVQFSAGVIGAGMAFFEATVARGHEGVMAKYLGSTYRPGRRSSAWRKIKPRPRKTCKARDIISY